MSSQIKLRNTVALLVGICLAAVGLGESISAGLHVPAARIIAAECRGFESLATAGGKPLTCEPEAGVAAPHAAMAVDASPGVSAMAPVPATRA